MLNGAKGDPVAGRAAAPSRDGAVAAGPDAPDPSSDGSFGTAPTLGATEDAATEPPGVAEVPTVGTGLVDDGELAVLATEVVVEGNAVVEVVVGSDVVVVDDVVVGGKVVVVVDVEVVVEPLGSVVVVEVVGGGFVTGGPVVVVDDGVSSPTPLPVSLAEACNAPVIDSIAACAPASPGENAMAITHDSPGSRVV